MHKSQDSRKEDEKNAVDAVATAVVFDLPVEISRTQVCDRLGITNRCNQLIVKATSRALFLRTNNKTFEPEERATRSNCYRDEAWATVQAYCHSETEDGAHLDTESC